MHGVNRSLITKIEKNMLAFIFCSSGCTMNGSVYKSVHASDLQVARTPVYASQNESFFVFKFFSK